ncbi:PD-(D/E)XK nuclease family protein [Cnuibacter physcomitrellae]|uniref:UrvD/REP family ATP-dependent DNA helicase n=1 Tax=Cnuibacter physcomitrellae TaxID=1619308 RepID=UPI002175B941|nr:UrvD/REP family ATP-dependent DNA helicase [Cnuibacter physcomitrellae]MCS5496601.1 PD-(D/E)XK nuclease family protein [Cnuibacter physcomitrellae]
MPIPDVQLDASQRAVLDRPASETFAVLGGPGSGKTTTAVALLVDRIRSGLVEPGRALLLTPRRTAAAELRDELALRIGTALPGPLARTPASVAFEVASATASSPGRPVTMLSGAEHDRLFADLLESGFDDEAQGAAEGGVRAPAVLWPDHLPPEVRRLRSFRTELRELAMRASERGVGASLLAELGRRESLPEWEAAGAFLAGVASTLDASPVSALDSAEVLAEATRAVRAGEALGGLGLVVVDDFHDLDTGAVQLLRALAGAGTTVVAFGDPDAATAAFRGADPRSLAALRTTLGVRTGPLAVLSTSHRQGGRLRRLTAAITERIGTAGAGRQRAMRPADGTGVLGATGSDARPSGERAAGGFPRGDDPTGDRATGTPRIGRSPVAEPEVRVVRAAGRGAEIAALARLLREQHLLHGVEWSDMAVVVRSGGAVPGYARGLAASEVPTRTTAGALALRDTSAARHLAEVIGAAIGWREIDDALVVDLVLGPVCGLDAIGLRRLRLALRHAELAEGGSRSSEELLREALLTPGSLVTLDLPAARRVEAMAALLRDLRAQRDAGGSTEELLWALWRRSGLAERWLSASRSTGVVADEAGRDLDAVVALFSAAKRAAERDPSGSPEAFLDGFFGAEVPEDSLSPRSRAGSVLVTTPVGIAGREVAVVVVAGLQESVWPDLRLRNSLLHAERLDAALDAWRGRDVTTQREQTRADVLADELRLFSVAVSRSRSLTVLSCVASDDERPSPFLALAPDAPEYTPERHPYTLRGLVGSLRRAVAERADARAASALARLSREGVAGADPAEWFGVLDVSTHDPLADLTAADTTVRVSPSSIETFEESPLVWFVDHVAGSTPSVASGVGTIVHAVMEEASAEPDVRPTVESLAERAESRWSQLRFEAGWVQEREHRALVQKLAGLSDYLSDRASVGLLGAETPFEMTLGPATVGGTIDRVETDASGRVVVVDLKTGKTPPSRADAARHAQLATYQLALADPGVRSALGVGDAGSGGAALVYVSKPRGDRRYTVVSQEALDDVALDEIVGRIQAVATGMAGTAFEAALEPGERDIQNRPPYRIQLVKAVSE